MPRGVSRSSALSSAAKTERERVKTIEEIEETMLEVLERLNHFTNPCPYRRRASLGLRTLEIRSPNFESDVTISIVPGRLSGLARLMRAMAQIHSLLVLKRTATKRDLYYEYKKLYREQQRNLDSAVSKLCKFLHRPRSQLNVTSTSRGFAMGNLKLMTTSGAFIDFSLCPIAIVEELLKFKKIETKVEFVLVVEKDTVFRRLIDDRIFEKIPNVLLVTGRGFPDLCTRAFLRWFLDKKPMNLFCLVDCDPYGLHIYATYRYGAVRSEVESNYCTLKEMNLLGLMISDTVTIKVSSAHKLSLSNGDLKRLAKVRQIAENEKDHILMHQVNLMKESGFKLELEALSSLQPDFILQHYLIPKLKHYSMIT